MADKDLEQKILQEIQKTGFPLELRITKFLDDSNYVVINNLYFVDGDEGKEREIDLQALKNINFKKNGKDCIVRYSLLIECKKSDKPWVIFTSPPMTCYDWNIYDEFPQGLNPNVEWLTEEDMNTFEKIHPYGSFERLGRNYFEPFKNSEKGETIFKALTTSVKAMVAMKESDFGLGAASLCFYYPVVVFDGKLYEAFLDNENIQIRQSDAMLVSFHYESAKYKELHIAVLIVTEKASGSFFKEIDKAVEFYAEKLKNHKRFP